MRKRRIAALLLLCAAAYDGAMPDWEKNTPLGQGWMIQAPYILRG